MYREYAEKKFSRVMVSAIALSFNKFDEMDNWYRVRRMVAVNQFYHSQAKHNILPRSILILGKAAGILGIAFSSFGYRVQLLTKDEQIERTMRRAKNHLNFHLQEGIIHRSLFVHREWDTVNTLDIDTVLVVDDLVSLEKFKEAQKDSTVEKILEVLDDNSGRLIFTFTPSSEREATFKSRTKLSKELKKVVFTREILWDEKSFIVVQCSPQKRIEDVD